MIKVTQLDQAIQDCIEHIECLLRTSKFLYDNSKFDVSLYFSIIIYEELAKLNLYAKHSRTGKPLKSTEFENFKKHKKKLTYHLKERRNHPNNYNKSSYEATKKFLENLDEVKHVVIYHEWHNDQSLLISKILSRDEMDALAKYMYVQSKYLLKYEILCSSHKTNDDNKLAQIIKDNQYIDPLCDSLIEHRCRLDSEQYKIIENIATLSVKKIKDMIGHQENKSQYQTS